MGFRGYGGLGQKRKLLVKKMALVKKDIMQ